MKQFFDKIINIYRLEAVGNKQSYATLTTTIDSCIQPLGDEKTAMAGGAFGKMFKIFVDVDRDINDGDKIKDQNGNWYKIVAGGVENRDDGFMADYMALTVQKINYKDE